MINIPLTERQHIALVAVIKSRLIDRGWSAIDLARATGYNVHTIYRLYKTNIKASRACVYEVTRVLGIDLEDL